MAPREFKGGKSMSKHTSSKSLKIGTTMAARRGSRVGELLHALGHEGPHPSASRVPSINDHFENTQGSHQALETMRDVHLHEEVTRVSCSHNAAAMELEEELAARVSEVEVLARVSCGRKEVARVSSPHEATAMRLKEAEAARVMEEGQPARVSSGKKEADRVLHDKEPTRDMHGVVTAMASPSSSLPLSYAAVAAKGQGPTGDTSMAGSWTSIVVEDNPSMKLSYIQPPSPSSDGKITIKPPSSVVHKGMAR